MEKKIKIKDCDKDRKLNGAIIIYEKMPSKQTKYVTEERFQEAVTSIRKDMVTEERFQEAITSIRKDMVTHDELHKVVNDAINGLEERMTKLILSLRK
jgi:prefoldin subunit 5